MTQWNSPITAHGLTPAHDAEAAVRYFMRTRPGGVHDDVAEPQLEISPAPAPAPLGRFGEASRQAEAARASYRNGELHGKAEGYLRGSTTGLLIGLAVGLVLGALLTAAALLGAHG